MSRRVAIIACCILSSLSGCLQEVGPELSAASEAATSEVTLTLQTLISGEYVCAENGGGAEVNANRPAAQAWETFSVVDPNGSPLTSGDVVYLRASNGLYLQAAEGGGGNVNAASPNQLDWEAFRIVKRDGSGPIATGDVVGLQTYVSGLWLSALVGGGGAVAAHGERLDTWESFRVAFGGSEDEGRRLVWSDEFDGNAIDESKWSYEVQRPGWVNHELQNYTDHRWENARVEDGHLVIEARRDWYQGHEYSSARLKTQGKASFRYGRVEARIEVPGGWGTWPAFWMMPEDFSRGWPACGEIDIMEEVGYEGDVVHATTHAAAYNWQRAEQRTAWTDAPGATSGFHIYALEWTPDRIDVFVDGRLYFTSENPHWGDDWWPFDKNFYVILNLAVGGDWGGAQGVDPNIWPRRMLVDYVRVYER
jgi:hypothetical protein